jgi:hypothetical protein
MNPRRIEHVTVTARHSPTRHRPNDTRNADRLETGAGQGAGGTARVPLRGRHRQLPAGQQAVNVAHARIRAIGEQAMATLKGWRLLRKLRCSTTRITAIVQAVLALHLAASG